METNNSELNAVLVQQLFDALGARGSKDYTLGYLFSVLYTCMSYDQRVREDIVWHINNVRKLNKEVA